MADVYNSAFAAEPHAQWQASHFEWDPSRLHAVPSPDSGSGSFNGNPMDPLEGGRDQELGPLPVGWEDSSLAGATGAPAGGKETKTAHSRAAKGPLVCQVEGCGHDLSVEKGYYQRYRVCEPHMKLLSLVVNGKPCRFCQQCGRFQELTEFDGSKRSCRARLLQHNARRRKRDPYDTSRAAPLNGRKSKAAHPWSGSSDDAEPVSRGSVDVSHGADKGKAGLCVDGVVDQIFTTTSTMATNISPGSGVPAWPAGASSLGVGIGGAPLEPPGARLLPASIPQQPLSMAPLSGPPLSGPSLSGQPLPGQPPAMQLATKPSYVRWQSGNGLDVLDPLDDMLDGILGSEMDYLDDPMMSLPARPADARERLASSGVTVNPAFLPGGASLSLGRGAAAQPTKQQPEPMWVGDVGGGGMTGSPMQSGAAAMGSNASFGSSLPSLSGAGPWQPGSMSLGAGAADLAAQKQRALQLQQQRQLQELQMQHRQQQMQLQQQLLGRGAVNSGSSSRLSVDTYMSAGPSAMGATAGGGVGSGLVGPGSGTFAAGQSGGGGQNFSPRPSAGVWAPARTSGTPDLLSGSGALGGANMDVAMGLGLAEGPSSASSLAGGAVAAPPRPGNAQSSFDLARRLVAGGGAAAQYRSEDLMVRVSIKIANCTPDQLPPDLYQRLRNLLNTADASLVQGFLRPGCTHLVLDILQPRGPDGYSAGADYADGPAFGGCVDAQAPLSAAALRACLGPACARGSVLVQTEQEICLWPGGAPQSAAPQHSARAADLESSGCLPRVEHVSPAAHVDAGGGASFVVCGSRLLGAGVQLFARMQGGYLPLTAKPLVAGGEVVCEDAGLAETATAVLRHAAALKSAGRKVEDALLVTVQGAPGTGLLLVEAQSGPLLSNWRPCLLSSNAGVAAELAAWGRAALRAGPSALESLEAFIVNFGRLMDKRSYAQPAPPSASASSRWASAGPISETIDEGDEGEMGADGVGEERFVDASSRGVDAGDGGITMELVCACERLLGWAADAGLARVSSFLASALLQYGQGPQAILEAPYANGLSVLHRCARSGSPAAVAALAAWAASCGVKLSWGCAGELGLCPLHLASLLPRTWSALSALPGARAAWAIARAPADGATPATLQRMLLQQLPADAAALALADVFAAPTQRAAAVRGGGARPVEGPSPLSKEAPASQEAAFPALVDKASLSNARPFGDCVPGFLASIQLAPLATSALIAVLVSALLAMHMPQQADGSDSVIRLTPVTKYCTSALCVALLSVAGFLLPVKNAASLLSQVRPASACIPTP